MPHFAFNARLQYASGKTNPRPNSAIRPYVYVEMNGELRRLWKELEVSLNRYNPDIHHHRSIRLKDCDYSQCGACFVTTCTQSSAHTKDSNYELSISNYALNTGFREVTERKPLRAVFRDNEFTSSPGKINVFEIFKLLAPNMNVRVL